MFSLIPLPYRLLALALAAAALFGSGWFKGHASGRAAGEADLAAFRASVEVAGAKQAAHTQEVIAQQEAVNVKISSDYEGKLAALRARYSSLQQSAATRPDGSAVPALSCPAPGTDGRPANPVSAVARADFDQLAGLAAQTTQQLVSLQDWVRQQQAAFP